jgi:hypothetical protein
MKAGNCQAGYEDTFYRGKYPHNLPDSCRLSLLPTQGLCFTSHPTGCRTAETLLAQAAHICIRQRCGFIEGCKIGKPRVHAF